SSQRSQGVNTVEWNMENNGGRRIASGIYIVMIRVKAEGKEEIKKFKAAFIAQVEEEKENRFAAVEQDIPQDASSKGLPRPVVNAVVKLSQALTGKNIGDWDRVSMNTEEIQQAIALLGSQREIEKQLEAGGIIFVRGPPSSRISRFIWQHLGVANYVDRQENIYVILPENASISAIAHDIWAVLNPDKSHQENPIFTQVAQVLSDLNLFSVKAAYGEPREDMLEVSGFQHYSGHGWASTAGPVNGKVSQYKYLNIKFEEGGKGNFVVQLRDIRTPPDSSYGVNWKIHSLSGKKQIITIPLTEFPTYKNEIATVVVHYGPTLWSPNKVLNKTKTYAPVKKAWFSNAPGEIKTKIEPPATTIPQSQEKIKKAPKVETKDISGIKVVDETSRQISWLSKNISKYNVPYIHQIPKGKEQKVYKEIGPADSVEAAIERIIVKEGTSAYDGACWQIALAIEGSPGALGLADNLTKVLWQGRLGLLQDLRAYYDPSNVAEHPFIYNDPQGRDISKYEEGKRGYFFRIFNGNGIWQTKDPLNGKAHLFGYPGPGYDPSLIVWCDWRPITGENMWGGIIGPLQVAYKKYKSQIPEGAIELRLAKEIARAGMLLQTEIGGIRFAPKGTWSEQGTEWPYNEISTENNTSAYAGYRELYKVAKDEIYKKTMQGIKNYMRSYAFDKKNNIFYQGMHFDGKKWIPNDEHFAVDCQTWPIIVFGPEEIDSWHDEGTAYKIWKNTKERAGYFDQKGNILGLGYTDGHDVMSIEWTSGGVFACRELASYYKNSRPDWAEECAKDAQTMRQGIDLFKVKVSDNQVAYPYASKRVYIPFGWWSPPTDVLNTCSTSWVVFLDIGFNPFVLGGGDKDLKPKEIKKEEKTQEINSQESQEVVNPSVGRKLIYVDEDNLIFILPSGDIQTLKAEGKLLSKKGGEHFWLWGWLVSWIKGWDDVQVRSLEGEIYWVDKDDLLELGKRNNGSTLTNKSSPEQSLWVQVVSKIISPFEENAFCETKESRDQRAVSTSVPEINWLLNNTFDDGMPHSFQVPEEYTTKGGENYTAQEIWESMGPADSVGAVMERILTRWGLNIYDGACWQTALAATGNKELAEKGRVSTNTLLHGRWGELRDLRAYYVANDPEHPFKYRGTIVPKENCYFFRIISPYYYQSDPLDGKTYLAGFPNNPRIHHEDWKPIDGENAFGPIIGPLQIEYLIYDGKIPLDAPGVILALSVIPAKKAMQNEIGAIHHAPEGTYGKDPDDVSNENNFSDYRAFKMLCEVTAREDINEMMQKQIGYFRDYAFDKEENYFYQGGFYRDGQFIPTKTFAVDCQTWGILSLTPQLIDQLYGEGSAYKIWKTTKERAGYYIDEVLRGLGYTDGHDVCSVEWSCGGIFACRELANYYQDSHPDWAAECANDALTMREGIGAFKVTFDNGEESYLYANKRYYIPFGWWANPIPSTVSTAWVYLVDKGFNPFILGGEVSAIVNEAPVITRMEVTPKKGKLPLEVSFIAEAADADGTIVKYLWNFGDGESLEGKTVTHTYTTAGTYTVTLTVTDNDGKSVFLTKSVEVVTNEAPVDDSVIANFFTYPNPVKGAGNMMKIRYELSREADEVLIKIYDIAGELVKEIHPSQRSQGVNTVEWNMENNGGRRIASGIYIVMIRVKAEGKEEIKKFKVAFIAQVEQEEKNRFAAIKQNKNEVD
ncbi:MAG: PKD domain-containing protein, partial [Candidatus Omnitrophica bacterium]|nr:PKD domain-containing protein [Candidatus Omnitrophota bacterium]